MRILLATPHREIVGGVETYLRALLPALSERGHELALLHEHPAQPGQPSLAAHVPDMPAWCAAETGALDHVSHWRPDVVYLQGLATPELEETLVEKHSCVAFAHNYHGTCVSGTKRFAFPHTQPCERTLGLGCLLRYVPRRCGGLNPGTMFRHYRQQRRRHELLTRYRAVVVGSTHMHAEYRRHGVAEERLHHVPLFPTDASPDRTPPVARPRTDRVLFVGRVTPLKGLLHLVEALPLAEAALHRKLTLVVAGDGPERAEAEKRAKAAGIVSEFLGWVNPERRTALMRAADVLAVPSVWPEPFALVGIEAGCVGLPAVCYALGGIPDWLVSGVSGESAPGNRLSSAELSAALVRALAEPDHLQSLRRGAWETSRRFSLERHLSSLEEILAAAALPPSKCGTKHIPAPSLQMSAAEYGD